MAAAKRSKMFTCSSCGETSSSWSGKCFSCGEWNTLVEETAPLVASSIHAGGVSKARALAPETIATAITHDYKRLKTGKKSFDDLLGGGVVRGGVVLFTGEPGIGKSTLLIQIANYIAAGNKVLYVSGEESVHQVSMRASRLKINEKNLEIASSNSAEDIAITIASKKYDLVVVDSIQTVSCSSVPSIAGSVPQITNSTHLISTSAKSSNTSLILVGHVTKEGSIAGPKLLEHIVDVVLFLEGDRYGGFRILKSSKNRYGSTADSIIYEMSDAGMKEVVNPSANLLAERSKNIDGSVIFATLEGTRPILTEVQALVHRTSYGYPKRTASGVELNRLNLLIAMLEKRTNIKLGEHDVYVNIIGGLKVREPAVDLAICLAIASSAKSKTMKNDFVIFGELGLSGEIRHVPFVDRRIDEAKKMGFEGSVGPAVNSVKVTKDHRYLSLKNVQEAIKTLF
jgi:DNA repair protein RadA/Sms